ncbi:MAG: hypothetical protein VX466_14850 [Myxococcota bacterium]|nr:hypothetical protein [Myxococcota bacterium]
MGATVARDASRTLLGLAACVLLGLAAAGVRANGGSDPRPEASPAARLAKGSQASEYWDLAATFDSGHHIFVRFQVTNAGPGDYTAYALGHLVFPDGQVVQFQNGRLERNWQISEDRLRLEVGSSLLDLHAPVQHFEVDKNKKGIKLFFDYTGTGPIRSWPSPPDGYHLDLLTLGGAISGSLWVRGVTAEPVSVEGTVTVTHAWMDDQESELARLRVEPYGMAATADGSHLYAVGVEPTKGPARSWMLVRTGEKWLETDRFAFSRIGDDASAPARYPLPTSLSLRGADVSGRVDFGRTLLRHDPLTLAPALFRWALSLRSKPSQVWLESRYAIEWRGGGKPLALQGKGVTSFYYLNPLK